MTEETKYRYLPLTVSLETLGGIASPIVRRGTPLPAKRKQQFSTAIDNQKAVLIDVYIGESPIAANNIRIGQVELTGIPEAPRGEAQIHVVFEVDQACKIAVAATEKKSGKTMSSDLQVPATHLTAKSVEELLRKATESLREDQAAVQAIEARNAANSLIHRAEKYLQDQQRYGFSNSTDNQIEETLASLGVSMQQDDVSGIRDKSKRLRELLPDATIDNLGALFSGGGDIFGGFFGKPQPRAQRRSQPAIPTTTGRKLTTPTAGQTGQSEEVAESKRGLFSAGQHFDAKRLVRDLFAQATRSIIIIDCYVGEDVLSLLTVKGGGVSVKILSGKISPAFLTLARDFARQYKGLEIRSSKAFHDRFIIIDDTGFYHFGASLEHLGNKTFMFSKIEEPSMQAMLQQQWKEAWEKATPAL